MAQFKVTIGVRPLGDGICVLDIQGDITTFAENALMEAHTQASAAGARTIILNLSDMEHMNSGGIGLLVTFLIRAERQTQRLLAYGLGEHYRHIFALTRLNEAILICDGEGEALALADGAGVFGRNGEHAAIF